MTIHENAGRWLNIRWRLAIKCVAIVFVLSSGYIWTVGQSGLPTVNKNLCDLWNSLSPSKVEDCAFEWVILGLWQLIFAVAILLLIFEAISWAVRVLNRSPTRPHQEGPACAPAAPDLDRALALRDKYQDRLEKFKELRQRYDQMIVGRMALCRLPSERRTPEGPGAAAVFSELSSRLTQTIHDDVDMIVRLSGLVQEPLSQLAEAPDEENALSDKGTYRRLYHLRQRASLLLDQVQVAYLRKLQDAQTIIDTQSQPHA